MSTGNKWIDLAIGVCGVLLVRLVGLINNDQAIHAAAGMIAFALVFYVPRRRRQ